MRFRESEWVDARRGRAPGVRAMALKQKIDKGVTPASAVGATPDTASPFSQARALPPVRTHGGLPLIDALRLRHSTREYDSRALPVRLLSDLLWAAFGINRAETGDRTAPYWRHVMVIDVYVAMADGVWIYAPGQHELLPYLATDIRATTGLQDFVSEAPVELVYVAHGERMQDVVTEDRRLYASVDAAFIGQNVYLFCASEGLGTVFRGAFDSEKLARVLNLADRQFITFVQTVGYPKVTADLAA
ncbi:nitroreductase family protein [Rhodanobacter umsongensis]|uniref:Nitroreductase family protein n=1 Tax=Rhodanobacter umsongensis TaxID=633153 RepID=A0ABW0JNZ2_9GAMM